jgi:hypothetical protein
MRLALAGCLLSMLSGCASTKEEPVTSSPLWPVHHVSISIDRPPADVYAYAADPNHLPRWAKGLANAPAELHGKDHVVDTPMGKVKVRFAERNPHGILDHDVTLPSGETVHNPMRVLPNARGSEVVFSVFQRPGTDAAEFRRDTDAVTRDLRALKELVEAR